MSVTFIGVHADILIDISQERDIEGSLGSGKTTVCLWDELDALYEYPTIWNLIARYSDDAVSTKLRPSYEQLISLHDIGKEFGMPAWNDKKKYYEFGNGSRTYAFGLKAASLLERYEKIRGVAVSRIFVDQAESVPADVAVELRARLRPDIIAKERGITFPTQLTFSANPVNTSHWLAKQFPTNNSIKRRKYFCVPLSANAHNLPPDMIDGMIQATPPDHPKYQTIILGQRGLNVLGDPIYEGLFNRKLHIREVAYRESAPILESYEVGKHNPCWIAAQRDSAGGINFLGGILGKELMIDDFIPLVQQHRDDWFPVTAARKIESCTGPMGDKHTQVGARFTLMGLLREAKIYPRWADNGNAPDVRLAMIEYLAGQLRRRTANAEAISVSNDPKRWLMRDPSTGELTPSPFLAFAFEGGYTWSEHFVSVSNKEIRQPNEDDEFANIMHAVEHLCLNFFAGQPSQQDLDTEAMRKSLLQPVARSSRQGPFGSGYLG